VNESLAVADLGRTELYAMYAGGIPSGIVALKDTATRAQLPIQWFDDLIKAFDRINDHAISETSINCSILPLFGESGRPSRPGFVRLPTMQLGSALSDATCTALQLANFWQDVIVDLDKAPGVPASVDLLERHEIHWKIFRSGNSTCTSALP